MTSCGKISWKIVNSDDDKLENFKIKLFQSCIEKGIYEDPQCVVNNYVRNFITYIFD